MVAVEARCAYIHTHGSGDGGILLGGNHGNVLLFSLSAVVSLRACAGPHDRESFLLDISKPG